MTAKSLAFSLRRWVVRKMTWPLAKTGGKCVSRIILFTRINYYLQSPRSAHTDQPRDIFLFLIAFPSLITKKYILSTSRPIKTPRHFDANIFGSTYKRMPECCVTLFRLQAITRYSLTKIRRVHEYQERSMEICRFASLMI